MTNLLVLFKDVQSNVDTEVGSANVGGTEPGGWSSPAQASDVSFFSDHNTYKQLFCSKIIVSIFIGIGQKESSQLTWRWQHLHFTGGLFHFRYLQLEKPWHCVFQARANLVQIKSTVTHFFPELSSEPRGSKFPCHWFVKFPGIHESQTNITVRCYSNCFQLFVETAVFCPK